jgi:hypothetical protein
VNETIRKSFVQLKILTKTFHPIFKPKRSLEIFFELFHFHHFFFVGTVGEEIDGNYYFFLICMCYISVLLNSEGLEKPKASKKPKIIHIQVNFTVLK